MFLLVFWSFSLCFIFIFQFKPKECWNTAWWSPSCSSDNLATRSDNRILYIGRAPYLLILETALKGSQEVLSAIQTCYRPLPFRQYEKIVDIIHLQGTNTEARTRGKVTFYALWWWLGGPHSIRNGNGLYCRPPLWIDNEILDFRVPFIPFHS